MSFGSASNLWDKWNIRGCVILSLSLQVFLILFAPFRKKIANRRIVFLLWLAYLMADSVVVYGIGLISHGQSSSYAHAAKVDISLQAFWASFLLLHLGGPDTITAFSLEDSSLWKRHMLSLIFQVGSAIYLFGQIFFSDKSLVIPTMLVFLAGVIKNVERVVALNLSSLSRLRESVVVNYKQTRDAFAPLVEQLETLVCDYASEEEAKLAESEVVKHAYYFFSIFEIFVLDLFYTDEERRQSHTYFCKIPASDALRVISVELDFIYEALHTKTLTIHSRWSCIFRFIAFTEVVMAFILFNRFKKHQLRKLDVEITHTLLFGGIALDVIALFMLIFSDWTLAKIKWFNTGSSKLDSFLHKLISAMDDLRRPQSVAMPNTNGMYVVLDTPFIFRRWSESIYACNIFSTFLKKSPRKMYKRDQHWGILAFSTICSIPFHMVEKIISCYQRAREIVMRRKLSIPRYVSKNPFIHKLWIYIFQEVRRKSEDARNPEGARKIFEARGDLFLQGRPEGIDRGNLLEHFTEASYENIVITWHVATEIWHNKEKLTDRNDEREFSKILSDYLLYLFLNQPNVVSAVLGFAQFTLADMLDRLKNHFTDAKDLEGLCKTLYDDPLPEDMDVRYPLRQGIVLARKMESLGERKWKVMSGVWVEMLSYAAGHIKGEAHVQVLSKGGELLAFVWLLMAHFGCLYKPEWGTFERDIFGTESETELDDDNANQEEGDNSVETQLV